MVTPSIGGQRVGRAPSYMTTSNANMMGNRSGQPSIQQQQQQQQAFLQRMQQQMQQQGRRAEPANPFEGNEQYQALMEYQKSMQPNQEQQDRMDHK